MILDNDRRVQRMHRNVKSNDGCNQKNQIISESSISLWKMSLKSFPIIFFNMGGEMVYILDQRLSAQEIVDQKAMKGWWRV